MFSHDKEPMPGSRGERWIYAAFVVVVAGLFAGEVISDFSLAKLVAVFFLLSWMPLLVLHEFGHALAAVAVGWYVGRIVIGFGPAARTFQLGETQLVLRWFPVEGFIQAVPRDLNLPRVKSALIYFAGPGVELLLAGVMVLIIGRDTMLAAPETVGMAALQGLTLSAVSGAVVNLTPHGIWRGDQHVPNDGLGILLSFTQPESHFAEQIGTTYNPATDTWEAYDSADWWQR